MIDDTYQIINELLKKDHTVPDSVRTRMQKYADSGNADEFYPAAIFYALSRKNELLEDQVQADDFIEVLDCLFMLGKIELIQGRDVLHYVEKR